MAEIESNMESEIEALDGFDDLQGENAVPFAGVDWRVLRHPRMLQAGVALAAASFVLLWPGVADELIAVALAVGLGALSLGRLIRALPVRSWFDATIGTLGVLAAVLIMVARRDPNEILAMLIGVWLAIVGLSRLYRLLRAKTRSELPSTLALIAVGLLLIAFPQQMFRMVIVLIALYAGLFAAVAIATSLDPAIDGVASLTDSRGLIQSWLASRYKSADDRQALYDKILFEGPATTRRLARFLILMTFASIIASMGVITDSTAVVIGAMLIAPLMTPLMGGAISLIMGWPTRLRRSALVAAAGIGLAIVVGLVAGAVAPTIIDTAANSQITGRSSPTVLDLVTALAAGAAGAYALSRPDVSDSLPGVAIAISLVPPLSVVGIAYSQGDFASGNGALLLFATNMLAILTMGGVTFVLTGVTPLARLDEQQHRLRTWAAAVGVAGLAVLGALLINGSDITRSLVEQNRVNDAVADWISENEAFTVANTAISGDVVVVVVVGPNEDRPGTQPLADTLSAELERPITARVRHVVELSDSATGSHQDGP
jgi:uncharacterized hydrophobic protein (TIGR00271 family)